MVCARKKELLIKQILAVWLYVLGFLKVLNRMGNVTRAQCAQYS